MKVYVPVSSDRYEVWSYGNGWAYEVRDVVTGYGFWVQDSDADKLQKATNNFEDLTVIQYHMEEAELVMSDEYED